MQKTLFLATLVVVLLASCRPGTAIFGKKTPHEQYADKLSSAGLRQTALGIAWFEAAARSLDSPLRVTIPYRETGYFAAEKPQASGLYFQAVRGQKLNISLEKRPPGGFTLYFELWRAPTSPGERPRLVAAADSLQNTIEHEVDQQTQFIVRVQPELLKGGEYTLNIATGPSLAYPVGAPGRNHTQSFWGADRDGGQRRHEGIDMFAAKRTPVLAAADGRVTRVNENNLGGKVVWMRPAGKDYTLYYAHLDQQLVSDGQAVKTGDTLGLMGNTGNAKYTAPHLHFGIYTSGGAIDPFPFVNPAQGAPPAIKAPLDKMGKLVRAGSRQATLYTTMDGRQNVGIGQHTLMQVEAVTGDWYRVRLPDGTAGLVKSNQASDPTEIRKHTVKNEQPVFDLPDADAARKIILKAGEVVSILAAFNDFYFVRAGADITGWIVK